jgi:twitching motility protein PilJ
MDNKKEGINFQINYRKDLIVICALLVILIVGVFLNFLIAHNQQQNITNTVATLTELKSLGNTLPSYFIKDRNGIFEQQKLENRINATEQILQTLINGSRSQNIDSISIELRAKEMALLEKDWQSMKLLISKLNNVNNASVDIQHNIKILRESIASILPFYTSLPPSQITPLIDSQEKILKEINNYLSTMLLTSTVSKKNDYSVLMSRLKAVLNTNSLIEIKKNDSKNIIDSAWVNNAKRVLSSEKIVHKYIDNINEFESIGSSLSQNNNNFKESISLLTAGYLKHWQSLIAGPTLGLVISVLAIMVLISLIILLVRETRNAVVQKSHEHKINRASVWRLTDEIAHLADGDLTAHATVREDVTGAIAESVNYAIDALRRLVFTINNTAVQVSTSAQDAQITSRRLVDDSEIQVSKIMQASVQIQNIANSIEEVSNRAKQSTLVADNSVEIAKNGASIVQDSIVGMDKIKQQIQQTSKQIKRLGESSQEIGAILSLIDDITEQTNILALNAAIQAAMAGDAGKGFAVVAEEVQRLAEKSNHATKQIEALVHTIQHDTQETVRCMEQTTSQVVDGSKLAQDAGVALEKIESVSQELSGLIDKISAEANRQASSASEVSKAMQTIKDMTHENASGTMTTAGSVGQLAELAVELRDSVAGFKLPAQNLGQNAYE